VKTKLAVIVTLVAAGLIFAVYQPSNAITYAGHDGSLDNYLSKAKVEKYKGKKDLWVYIVKACATDRTLAVGGVILKSDIDSRVLHVDKNIGKGKCSYYGAVMNAKDGNTLGAELIEKHEAVAKMQQLLKDMPKMSKVQKQLAQKEYSELQRMVGYYLK
jgi:hypothetical protein